MFQKEQRTEGTESCQRQRVRKRETSGNLSGCCTHMPHATCRSELHTCLLCVRAVAAREEANNVNMWSYSGACFAPLELPLSRMSRMSRLCQDKAMLSLGFVSEIGFWALCVQTKRRRFVSSLSAVTGTTNNTHTHTHTLAQYKSSLFYALQICTKYARAISKSCL